MIFLWRCWSKVYVTNVKGLCPVLVAQKRSKWGPAKKSTVNNLLFNAASIDEQKGVGMGTGNIALKNIYTLACNFRHTSYRVTRMAIPSSLICEPVKVNFLFFFKKSIAVNCHHFVTDIRVIYMCN
jgi:hypothetical protein